MPWYMRAINHSENVRSTSALTNLVQRESKSSGRSGVAEVDDTCAGCNSCPKLFDKLFVGMDRQVDGMVDVVRADLHTVKLPGMVAGSVFMIGGQHLITGFEPTT